jgi:hypothetical protein
MQKNGRLGAAQTCYALLEAERHVNSARSPSLAGA